MALKVLIILLSLFVSGLLVGNELAAAVFIYPVLYSVSDEAHVRVAKPLARRLGHSMPFWYALGLVFAIPQILIMRAVPAARWLFCAGKEELKRPPQLHSRGGSGHDVRCVCQVPAFQFARNPPRFMPSVEVASYKPYQQRSSGRASFQIGEAHPVLLWRIQRASRSDCDIRFPVI